MLLHVSVKDFAIKQKRILHTILLVVKVTLQQLQLSKAISSFNLLNNLAL